MLGGNDFGPGDMLATRSLPFPRTVLDRYNTRMTEAINLVRRAAPNAQVTVAGYPSIISDRDTLCVVNVVPNVPMGVTIPGAKALEGYYADVQRDIAARNGARYVDVRAATRDRSTCAPTTCAACQVSWTLPPRSTR